MTQTFFYSCVCFLLVIFKKRLLKFDQELSACWKKSYGLRNRLPTHWSDFTSKISVNLFGSGSAGKGNDRCGSGSCLQIYRFHIPVINTTLCHLQLHIFQNATSSSAL